jgi:glycosyltransferase involved in cell wall biosynthesis
VVLSSLRASRDLTPGLTRRFLRLTDRLVSGIVVNCEAMRRHLVEAEGVPVDRVHLCYNGLDIEEFCPRPEPRPHRLSGAGLVIGSVGVLRPEKHITTLLDAFSQLRRTHPGLTLVVVGDGPSLPALQACSRKLALHEACVFEPATSQVASWYRAIDIFVLPSKSEALSNSLMEAMACGCAVVASRVGGNVELVQDGRTGLLFEAGAVDQLTAALARLVEHESLRLSLAEAGSRWIRERFSLTSSATRMADIYASLLATPSVKPVGLD